jgi:hypothetical protein
MLRIHTTYRYLSAGHTMGGLRTGMYEIGPGVAQQYNGIPTVLG